MRRRLSAGVNCSFLTIGSARYHNFGKRCLRGQVGGQTGVTSLAIGSSSCRRGPSALLCRSINLLWYGAKNLRINRIAPNETASGSNAGALSNKEKL
jgi:hypothetical protein